MKQLKNTVLILLFSMAITLGMMSVLMQTVSADDTPGGEEITTWAELQDRLDSGGHIELTENLTAGADDPYLVISENSIVTLDLNGKTLDRGLDSESAKEDGYVIKVQGNLTLKDSESGGKICGGYNSSYRCGGVYVDDGGNLTMKGGAITGNYADQDGGGVYVCAEGKFTMNGGSIENNSAGTGGGGIYVNNGASGGGSLTLNGGSVSNNSAGYGGGINAQFATVVISGCEITDNTAMTHSGGGVRMDGGSLTLESGSISGNNASKCGGGVYMTNSCNFTMSGGKICGNTAETEVGGGVCVAGSKSKLVLSGKPKITNNNNNMSGTAATDNVCISGLLCIIVIDGALDRESSVGVNMQYADTFTSGWGDKMSLTNPSDIFTSDDTGYCVGLNDSGEAYLSSTAVTVSFEKGDETASGLMSEKTVASGSKFVLPECGFTAPAHMVFKEWSVVIGDAEAVTKAPGDKVTVEADTVVTAVWQTEWAYLQSMFNAGGEVTLEQDYKDLTDDTPLTVPSGVSVTLDLKGHKIDRGLNSQTNNGYVILVEGDLIIKDSDSGGEIRGGFNTYGEFSGGGICVSGGSLSLESGKITENYSVGYGGGVLVANNGSFTMSGGSVDNNKANFGGGIYLRFGSFTMAGGSILGNNATTCGGAVFMSSSASFDMTGGVIGSAEKPNTASYDSGVYSTGSFTMSGGAITSNYANNDSGGVGIYDGTMTISGAPVISGNSIENAGNETACNLYLYRDNKVTIGGPLDSGASAGVTMDSAGTFTSGWEDRMGQADPADFFTSDNTEYIIGLDDNGEACLGTPVTVSFDKGEEGASGTMDEVTVASGSRYILPECGFTAEAGYVFTEWSVKIGSADSMTRCPGESIKVTSDTTVTARWKEHEHIFTYDAGGDTITATCLNEDGACLLTDNSAALKITAPELDTYEGTGSASATLVGLSEFNDATGKSIAETDITYVGRDGTTYEESTDAPADAGKYKAKITVETKTASVDYEIAKKDPEYKTEPAAVAEGLSYIGTLQTLINEGATDDGTILYAVKYANTLDDLAELEEPSDEEYSEAVPTGNVPGIYFVWYYISGDRNHKDSRKACLAKSINDPDDPSVVDETELPSPNTGSVYDGEELPLMIPPEKETLPEGAYFVYFHQKDSDELPEDAEFSESIPAEADAGSYYVWYTIYGDPNGVKFPMIGPFCVSIKKADAPEPEDIKVEQPYTETKISASVAEVMPEDAGKLTYAAKDVTKPDHVTVSGFSIDDKGSVTAEIAGGKQGDTITLSVIIGSTNYEDTTAIVEVILTHVHSVRNVKAVAAECEKNGKIEYWVCDQGEYACGKYYADAECNDEITEADIITEALGHNWSEWEETRAATETEEGEETRTCRRCNKKESRPVNKLEPSDGDESGNDGQEPDDGQSGEQDDGRDPDDGQSGKQDDSQEPDDGQNGEQDDGQKPDGGQDSEQGNEQKPDDRRDDEQKPEDRSKQMGEDGTSVGPGASAEAAEAAITSMTSDSDIPGMKFMPLGLKSARQTKKSITVKWNRPAGAVKYLIFGNRCGKKMKKLGETAGSSKTFKKINGKKVKKGASYKFVIVAIDKDNNVISTSKLIHAYAKGGKFTNHKSVKIQKKAGKKWKAVKKLTVKAGKTQTIRGIGVKAVKKLKFRQHAKMRYESSGDGIATVSKKGRIKGLKKGTCYVYVYSQNGVSKKIKVTVK